MFIDDIVVVVVLVLEDFLVLSKILYELKFGNGYGCNIVIEVVSGEIVFFIDDDCLVDLNVLIELVCEFLNLLVGFVVGCINFYNLFDYFCCYFYVLKLILFKVFWFLCLGYV